MNSPTLFDMPEEVEKVNWSDYATSLSFDERKIITWIMQIHNAGRSFDLDATYSTGRFWEGLPQPRFCFDLDPQKKHVGCSDARRLPIRSGCIDSIMFDPPFVVAPSPAPGIIRDRFTCFKNIPDLYDFYRDALIEFYRLLRPAGIVAFKCQDIVSSGKQNLSHVKIVNYAENIGFVCEDLFILARTNVLWSPNMKNQKHARKNHSYFLVLVKK